MPDSKGFVDLKLTIILNTFFQLKSYIKLMEYSLLLAVTLQPCESCVIYKSLKVSCVYVNVLYFNK